MLESRAMSLRWSWCGASSLGLAGLVVASCGIDLQGTLAGGDASTDGSIEGGGAGTDAIAPDADATNDSGGGDGGACALGAGGQGISCATGCVDPSRDRSNCGACGVTCGPAAACEGTCVTVAASVAPLRIEVPCTGGGSGSYCSVSGTPQQKLAMLTGTAGTTYELTLRFRGVVEQKTYSGASAAGATGKNPGFLATGGTAGVDNWNDYSLFVAAPALVLRLNRGDSFHDYVDPIDYTAIVRAAAGATLLLRVDPIDSFEAENRDDDNVAVVVPGIPPAPNAFDGQFVQIDVTSVRVAP